MSDEKIKETDTVKESFERFRTIIENAPVGYYRVGKDGLWQYVNPEWERMHGYSLQEVMGKSFEMTQPDDAKETARQYVKRCLAGETMRGEFGRTRKDGTLEYHTFNIQPVYQKGEIVAIEGFINDITERKNIEQKLKKSEANLRKLNIELEQKVQERTRNLEKSEEKYREAYNLVNFYKDLFTHDMNNILQNITSSAEFYSMFRNEPETLKKLGDISEVVIKHARRGSELISNVRKLSKLGETDTQLNIIEIFDILHQSVENTVSGFQERNVKIDIKGLSKDMKLLGNELLVDIFDNILNNAVKYNDNEKEVKVDVNVSKIQEDSINYIKFEFKDYGIGIIDEKKDDLFERQYTDDISERGMGMGLSLVKMIVDKYGGKLLVEDRVKGDYSKGSNFIVLLKEAQ